MKKLAYNSVFSSSLMFTPIFDWVQKTIGRAQIKSIFSLILILFTGIHAVTAQRTQLLIMTGVELTCSKPGPLGKPVLSVTLENGSFVTFGANIAYTITGGGLTAPLVLNSSAAGFVAPTTQTFIMTALKHGVSYIITASSGVVGGNSLTFTPNIKACTSVIATDAVILNQFVKCPTPVNLVSNGNFMYGNDGSFQSGLTYGCNSCTAGGYCIGNQLSSKCSGWAANTFDHTLGTASGSYMIVDGDATKTSTVWSSTVCVQNGVVHTFSFWLKSIYPAAKQTFDLGLLIDGVNKKTVTITQITPAWTKYEVTWTANKTGCIPIAIQQLTGGAYRDFGIDDIYFGYCSDCNSELVQNGEFIKRTATNVAAFWSRAYGNPLFNFTVGQGYLEDGYVEMKGDQIKGDAVAQQLAATNQIQMGKKYKLSVAVRFQKNLNTNTYGKIRAIAFNGTLPTTGIHPLPNANVAIIGRSGKIRDCGDWSFIEFPLWTATKDFQNIAINVFSDNSTMSTIWIDDVNLCETDEQIDCTEAQLDQNNNPIIPASYGTVPAGFNCTPEAEEENFFNGSLQNLYGQLYGYNGTSSLYSQLQEECLSIGGTLPPAVLNYNCDDSLKAAGINMTCEEFRKLLDTTNFIDIIKPVVLPPLGGLSTNCNQPYKNEDMAFMGKDIIYVHGLMLDHLCDRANGVSGAKGNWPNDPSEFYKGGYYKNIAENNWKANVEHYLNINNATGAGGGYRNRYLIVSYNCAQRADVAIHSVLSQIREAMENGKDVVFDSTDRRKTACFGREYVLISHSTGAIIADVALSIANKTKSDPALKAQYGDIGLLSDRCKGRISIRGALSGSSLATIMVAVQVPALSQLASAALTNSNKMCGTDLSIGVNRTMVQNSVLVDLVPVVTRLKWGNYINTVPVPVLTIASGHPSAITPVIKYVIHKGFDDGVVTMDCASGSLLNPSAFVPSSPLKVYDMGQPLVRGAAYYLDQRLPTPLFASASIPYLSPAGMVQPIASTIPITRFNNHFTFLQSASEHWLKDDYSTGTNYKPTAGATNNEEELVIENSYLFSSGIVNPAIISEMGEFIKGKYILLPKLVIKRKRGIPHFSITWIQKYIWKRTYHKMQDDSLFDFDYAYRYTFKN
jgi:hypothetical protein